MTYRDDHDAALARADALAVEVARLEDENAELVAERDRLAAEQTAADAQIADAPSAPEPAPTRPRRKLDDRAAPPTAAPARRRQLAGVVLGVLLTGGVIAVGISIDVGRGRAHDRWEARGAAVRAHQAHWDALISVEPCVRMVAYDAVMLERYAPERYDPRTDGDVISSFASLAGNCTGDAKALVAAKATRPEVKAGLARWLAVEAQLAAVGKELGAYYGNRDYVEDDLRGGRALWTEAHARLAERRAIFADLRTTALPALRAEIRALQAAHATAHGHDEIWWRIELGLALWAINAQSDDVTGVDAGRAPDDAAAPPVLRAPIAALRAASADAPIEVRRDLRKLDWITGPLADGRLPAGEAPLWHLAHPEGDLLRATRLTPPAPPPAPGPEPPTSD